MVFPLDFDEFSLFLAIISFILLMLLALTSSYKGNLVVLIDREKLEITSALILSLFLTTVIAKAIGTILLP